MGKFDVSSALYGRTAVTQALDKASNEAREGFKETLIEPVKENSVAIIADLWSEKFTRGSVQRCTREQRQLIRAGQS